MKREFLVELLGDDSKETIDKIMAQNGADIENAKKEVNHLKEELIAVKDKLETTSDALKTFDGVDPAELNGKISELTKALADKDEEYKKQLADRDFDALLGNLINEAGGKNAKAIKALLDSETLKQSKDQSNDIRTAIEQVKTDNDYLFKSDEPINNATGTVKGDANGGNTQLALMREAMGLKAKE